jgi:hypothetical protein
LISKNKKTLPPESLTRGAVTLNSQRLLLGDTEDVSCTIAGHSKDVKAADIPHLDLKKQKTPPGRKPDGRGCYLE